MVFFGALELSGCATLSYKRCHSYIMVYFLGKHQYLVFAHKVTF